MDIDIQNLLKKITQSSNESNIKEIVVKLNEYKNTLNDSQDNLIKAAIIDFFISINPLSSKWEENDIPNIAQNLLEFNYECEIGGAMEKIFKNIKNPLLNFLISFDDDNAFPEEKIKLKFCFKLILITQRKELLINYLRKFCSTVNIKDLEEEIFKLNFSNPFSIIFIHETLKYIFTEKNDKNNIVDMINQKIKFIQIFRCRQCFDLLNVLYSSEGTSLNCNNKLHNIPENLEVRKLNLYDLICCECKSTIKIYLDNYKCIKCKKFICNNCSSTHENSCLLSDLINLYDVGYTCEEHNKKYVDTCELCNKNLCEECKFYHFHIIKNQNHIKFDEEYLKSKYTNNLEKTKKYIRYYLIKRYFYMKEFNLINLNAIKSLHFILEKKQIAYKTSSFFSSEFFDDEFKQYYEYIIEGSKKGKEKEFDTIISLEREYKLVNLFSENAEYNQFIYLCIENKRKRNEELNRIYSIISNSLLAIEVMLNNSWEFGVKRLFDETNTNMILLKNQFIKLRKSNGMGQLYNEKLLTRYFADYIIKIIIKEFPNKFNPIKLSLINIYEIAKVYGLNFISDNHEESIYSLLKTLLYEKDKATSEQCLMNYINNIKEGNKVIFNNSIKINDQIIKKEELNFVLGSLLYLKQLGNYITHPNSKNEIEASINEINTNIKELNNFIEISSKSNNSDDLNSLIDLELKNEIKKELNELVSETLKDFENISFNKNAKLDYILDYMFKNESSNIIKKDNAFLRVIKLKIDDIVNDATDFDEVNIINNIINDEDRKKNPKKILKNIKKYENLIEEKINKFENYEIKKDKNIEKMMKSEVKEVEDLDFLTFPLLIDKYEELMCGYLTSNEKESYLLSSFGKEYLKSDVYIKKKEELNTEIKKFLKFRIIRRKMEKISETIKLAFDKSIENFDENNFIKEVKEYIKEQNLIEPEILSKLSFDIPKIFKVIQLLIGKKNINWLFLFSQESISISSYLYYMQHDKKSS